MLLLVFQEPASVHELNFDAFSGDALYNKNGTGVLWSYRPDNSLEDGQDSFQQDLEPEYVAFNEDATMAYVILQENNAVAFVSLVGTPQASRKLCTCHAHNRRSALDGSAWCPGRGCRCSWVEILDGPQDRCL